MKKSTKALSLIMTLVMLAGCLCIPSFAYEYATQYVKNPVIMITGQGSYLSKVKGVYTTSEQLYPIEIEDGYIEDRCKELIQPLSKGLLFNSWGDYNKGLYDAFMPYLEPIACTKDGTVTDGSGSSFSNGGTYTHPNGLHRLEDLSFNYDWRLDPADCVEAFRAHLLKVVEKTGCDKIDVIARCLAGNIILAYMDKYGGEHLGKVIFTSVGFDGFESFGAIFAGKVKFDAASVDRFVNSYLYTEDFADDPTFEALRSLVSVLRYNLSLSITADILQRVYRGIKDDSVVSVLRDSLATMPSFWSYIGDDYYEDAKKYIFGGHEDEYAGLIEKIDNYHYNIAANYSEILDKAVEDGAYIYNITKYGFQMLPVTGADDTMSDALLSVRSSSMGATASTVTGTLSDKYLAGRDSRFISPDRQIDASTCKYPEHTWFIKNLTHRNMPDILNEIWAAILDAEGWATVDEVENYPQFLVSDDKATELKPATEENSGSTSRMKTHFFEALIKVIRFIINYLKNLRG